LEEVVHRTLMRLYASLGRFGTVQRQYQTCVEASTKTPVIRTVLRIVDTGSLPSYCSAHVLSPYRWGAKGVFGRTLVVSRLTVLSITFLVLAAGSGLAAVDKDGPMAKISPELLALYDAYLAAQRGGIPFSPNDPLVRLVDDRVIVDATASGNVAALETDLRALGMRGTVSAGRIVSGQLPILAIGALANLHSLRFVRAAASVTHGGTEGKSQ